MHFVHRHSFFPFVVIVLTLLLGAIMVSTLPPKGAPEVVATEERTVDEGVYRDSLSQVVREFRGGFSQAVDEPGRAQAGSQALQALLNLRVPAQYKSLHLALAVFLSRVESGGASVDPLAELQTITQTYAWLSL